MSTYMAARAKLQERHYTGLPELRLAAAGGLPAPDLGRPALPGDPGCRTQVRQAHFREKRLETQGLVLGPVDVHREAMMAAARWTVAA